MSALNLDTLSFAAILYAGAIGLLVIGAVGMVMANHLFRMVLALAIAEAGANLLMVLTGWRGEAVAPILGVHEAGVPMVDPIPQVLVLTAIVIGVGVQALAVSVLLKIHRIYGTLDVRELRRHLELDICRDAGIVPDGSREAPAGERPLPPPIPPSIPARAAAAASDRPLSDPTGASQ
ncbi:MAG: NADH-quinone oxidoreductase subunit K [Thiohalocapsa sp.]|jgi:multisubunit Na+/H+ antiporter MnhC subunit|uniref:sodium:proton antiporter n=1 Tax=Thiohalocapsa sp. TaxID=2497641 RepID=UPI0025D358D2|nr:NADH-quinone oxidoreductase subunit K [Thiohalocapsa sp.]MCG6942885.1 NADH-quinone oxidoreductase subunit K [Thiohalocapsa sp.]